MSTSHDRWSPDLMAELIRVRGSFAAAYDAVWRKERLFRYVYWLLNHEHPSFNFVGCWNGQEILEELGLWKYFITECCSDEEIDEYFAALFEGRFGFNLEVAVELGTNPELANKHLPIWNVASGSLVPQTLGNLKICSCNDNQPDFPGKDITYKYFSDKTEEYLDLYLYRSGEPAVLPGIGDQRIIDEFELSLSVSVQMNTAAGSTVGEIVGPVVENLISERGVPVEFVSACYPVVRKDRDWISAISMTGFRKCFAKIRYSCPVEFSEVKEGQESIRKLNTDQAEFFAHFGP